MRQSLRNSLLVILSLLTSSSTFAGTLRQGSGTAIALPGWHWKDVIATIPRFEEIGFSAILLPPHTASCSGSFGGMGYDPSDFTSFDGGFGSTWELQEIIRVAHEHHMQVYADMIMNHMCTHDDYQYSKFSWNDFHHNGKITDWNDSYQRENFDLSGLNDLAQESDYVRGQLWDYLVKTNNMGFDGYRWDAVKHVPTWYWRDHVVNNVNAWGKYNFGEVYDADLNMLSSYASLGMSVTDYNLYYAMRDAFRFGGNLASLDGAGYAGRNGARAVTFVENHDVSAPENRLLAYAFLASYPGYPFFSFMDLNDSAMTNLVWIHANLAAGAYVNRWKEQNVLIFEREGNLIAALNQTDSWQSRWIDSSWASTKLHDYTGHTEDTWTYGDRRVLVNIPPMSYVMLAP